MPWLAKPAMAHAQKALQPFVEQDHEMLLHPSRAT